MMLGSLAAIGSGIGCTPQGMSNQWGAQQQYQPQLSSLVQHYTQIAQSQQTQQPKQEVSSMKYVKEYFTKHRELIMGVAIICLLDHFVFKDAFREKIQKIVHGILDKTEKKLTAPEQV